MSRVGRFFGAVLVWTVLAVAAAVLFVIGLPLLAIAVLLRWAYERHCALVRRIKGASVPDEATPELARRIDGADLGDVLSHPVLPCGCSGETTAYTCRRECGWRACAVHLHASHYCDPVPDLAVINDRFAHLINSPELRGLRRAPESLAPYYLIGDEK